MREPKSLLRTVGSISSATFISRILGLARDAVQAYYFGMSWVTDAFVVAFRIPNLLRDLFAEGALSAAFVPAFNAEHIARGRAGAWALANRVLAALFVILTPLTLAMYFGAPYILRAFAPGFEEPAHELATTMTRILAPFLLCVSLAALAMGALNAFGRFFVPALAPAAFNAVFIVSMVVLVPLLAAGGYDTGLALAIGAMAGGVLQLAVQVPALRREGFRLHPELRLDDSGVRRIGKLMLPATAGLAPTQVNILVDTYLATWYSGAPTALSYAFRLMQLPLGLFGVAIGTANLTRVSQDVARGDLEALRANLSRALRAGAILTLPAAAGLVALREPIVRVLFEHGAFDPADTRRTANAVLCYALGLFAYTLTKTQVPTFYALGETRIPVVASVTAVSLKIAANFVFLVALPWAGFEAFLGLALSTSLAAWTNFGILAWALRRRVGSLARYEVVGACVRMALLSALMGGAVALIDAGLERWSAAGLLADLVRLALAIGAGVLIVVVGVHKLGLPEGQGLAARLRSRLSGAS